MTKRSFFSFLMIAGLLASNRLSAQTQTPYKLPGSYVFDYQVSQVIVDRKTGEDSSLMHSFYTKSGDYAAVLINQRGHMKGNLFIVFTRDGYSVIFNEQKKNITIISIRKILSDFAGLTKWIRMDSVMAHMRQHSDGKQIQSVKTGNTKPVGTYTSEEYQLTDSLGRKASVWFAKVDFNTPADYLLGAGGTNALKMMSGQMTAHPLFKALTQPKTLITEINVRDSADGRRMGMYTVSIKNQIPTAFLTTGYQVDDYSNMSLPEIFQAEMKKEHH
jgi:hypothetical protein